MRKIWRSNGARRAVVAGGVGAVVLLGVALVVLAQEAAERATYRAMIAGAPCPSVARAPGYAQASALKTARFGGAQFRYLRGDLDCRDVQPGRLVRNAEVAVCVFDRPGFLSVASGGAKASYLIVIGQAAVRLDRGGPHCTVQPSP